MPETLLTLSSIKLFGGSLHNLSYTNDINTSGNNNFMQSQFVTKTISVYGDTTINSPTINNVTPTTNGLQPGMAIAGAGIPADTVIIQYPEVDPIELTFSISKKATATAAAVQVTAVLQIKFARIYAFSFEGAYYTLPRPTIFLVHGVGMPLAGRAFGRSTMDQTGVSAKEWEFVAGHTDDSATLSYWEYEKGDFLMRLDTEAGPLEQILLAAAVRAGADMADRSGASLGIRSGASLAGASLSGASLSGASLSGASLSGASLSGASLRNGR